MTRRRSNRSVQRSIPLAIASLLALLSAARSQTPPASSPQTNASAPTRPCSANPVLAGSGNKKQSSRKHNNSLPAEPAPTCIEVKGQAIDIQEFLQNITRKQAWRIGENRASEDTWSCVRYLDAEELEKFADTKVLIEPMDFTNGKAAVIVRTTDIGEGYTRVQISAHIQGEGTSTDRVSPQPASVWPLKSKGVLEQELVSSLQTGFKPME
jgi:hypothetical protein